MYGQQIELKMLQFKLSLLNKLPAIVWLNVVCFQLWAESEPEITRVSHIYLEFYDSCGFVNLATVI